MRISALSLVKKNIQPCWLQLTLFCMGMFSVDGCLVYLVKHISIKNWIDVYPVKKIENFRALDLMTLIEYFLALNLSNLDAFGS